MTEPGYAVLPGACLDDLPGLRAEADRLLAGSHAARNVLRRSALIHAIARRWAASAPVCAALGTDAFPVRALLFDKIPGENWQVPWHRDTAIAISGSVRPAGWGPWSTKDGIDHAIPPEPWLSRRLAIRFHLDDCPAGNGALLVRPGSHRLASDAEALPDMVVETVAGDVLVMHPLLLHASRPALRPDHRRVLHLEFANLPLPVGLTWDAAA